MTQYGSASVYGIDGTGDYNASGTAIAAFPESMEAENTADVAEFKDGNNEFIGSRVADKRERVDLVWIPKKTAAAGSLDAALKALKYPPIPCKVTLAGFQDSGASDIGHNGDYMYYGGARRTLSRGQAAFRMTIWRSLTSPLSTAQLLTLAT